MIELSDCAADTSKEESPPLPARMRRLNWYLYLPNSTVRNTGFLRRLGGRPVRFYRLLRGLPGRQQEVEYPLDAAVVELREGDANRTGVDLEVIGASPARAPRAADLDATVQAAFEQARDEEFEDGVESDFSRRLETLVLTYGNQAVEAIDHLVRRGGPDAEVLSEALRWLGSMKDAETKLYRRWVLVKALGSVSTSIRSGAVIGLAAMDDPAVLSDLCAAADGEPTTYLRQVMEALTRQLEGTARCQGSSD